MVNIVDVESPYAAKELKDVIRNIRYARACVRDSLLRGEIPVASHLLYTQSGILDDNSPHEREMGIRAGKELIEKAGDLTAIYTDLGMSKGMEFGVNHAKQHGRRVEYRSLGPEWEKEFKEHEQRHSHKEVWL
jgi:hypothetical protein